MRSILEEAKKLGLSQVDDYTIVDTCLVGFNTHRRYEATVAQLKAQKRIEEPFSIEKISLTKLEAIFISLDENAISQEKLFSLSDIKKHNNKKINTNSYTNKTNRNNYSRNNYNRNNYNRNNNNRNNYSRNKSYTNNRKPTPLSEVLCFKCLQKIL